ncbi:MAG TPA: M48 family peptidase [Aquifex aeolicus]|nr:M48 family peptidase [Aquifex aeolicus]
MKVRALVSVFLLLIFSCSQVVDDKTGKRESFLLPTEKEIALGNKLLPEAITQFEGVYPDKKVQEYVKNLGIKIAKTASRKLPYEFILVNSEELNAFALPGGKIIITRGLFLLLDKESELAGVLAHELGHVNARHHARYLEKTLGLSLLLQIGTLLIGGEDLTERIIIQLASIGATLLTLKFSRDQEREADKLGVRFSLNAGFDPHGLIDVFYKFKKLERNLPPEWLSTHPLPDTRIKEVSRLIKSIKLPDNLKKDSIEFHKVKKKLLTTKLSYKAYIEGKKFYRKGLKDAALQKFEEAIRLYPDNQIAMAYVSSIYLEKGFVKKALNYAYKITELDPYLLWGWYLKGIALFKLGNYRESIKALKEAKKRVESYAGIYYYLGRNYEAIGNMKKAIENYKIALKLSTGKEPWYEDLRGRLYENKVIF